MPPQKWTEEEHDAEVLYLMMIQWFAPVNYIERLRREQLRKLRIEEVTLESRVAAIRSIFRDGQKYVNISIEQLSGRLK